MTKSDSSTQLKRLNEVLNVSMSMDDYRVWMQGIGQSERFMPIVDPRPIGGESEI